MLKSATTFQAILKPFLWERACPHSPTGRQSAFPERHPSLDRRPVFKARPGSTVPAAMGLWGCQEGWASQGRQCGGGLFTPLCSAQHSPWHEAGPLPTFAEFTPLLNGEEGQKDQELVPTGSHGPGTSTGERKAVLHPTLSIYTQEGDNQGPSTASVVSLIECRLIHRKQVQPQLETDSKRSSEKIPTHLLSQPRAAAHNWGE